MSSKIFTTNTKISITTSSKPNNLSTPKNNTLKISKSIFPTLKNSNLKKQTKPHKKSLKNNKLSPNFNSIFLFYFRRLQNLRSQNLPVLHAERVNQLKSQIVNAQQRILEQENASKHSG
jgi:hypothetical protein